ncbi:MAG: NADH-quinone oxidoreductase subunit A [Bacteroidetes bacterium]|nr:MAG: NADH-quinone oxidoreductase subunit A [Bacteroidota bacterium]TAG87774.1 MAG: NADH-quinone oxidoreductase subunit A [Bacteroidota bacterium]
MMNQEVSAFGFLFIFIILAIILVTVGLTLSSFIRPARPNDEKLAAYECGEEALGNGSGQINLRFYLMGLIFILFEAEIVFLFPWAIVFGQKELIATTEGKWATVALLEMFTFLFILVLGLAYIWAKGYLEWVKITPQKSNYTSPVPKKMYEKYK